jgi:MFS family permease
MTPTPPGTALDQPPNVVSLAVASAVTVLAGSVTMALEMVLGRSFTPYFGGTLYTWGALVSVFMLGMAIGYAWGGRLADRWPSFRVLMALLAAAAVPIGLYPLVGEAVINRVLDQVEDVRYAALTAAVLLSVVPVALLAAASPLCVRLSTVSAATAGTTSGRLSALNTVGSVLGTLATSFYLIPSMGVQAIFYLLAGVCGLAMLVALVGAAVARPPTAEETL